MLGLCLALAGCASSRPCPEAEILTPAPPRVCQVDGCSLAPDFDFQDCCDAHDQAYWRGGTRAERLAQDRALRACLATRGHAGLAPLYFLGVRLGGSPALPLPWRWGFGWPYGRGYETEVRTGR